MIYKLRFPVILTLLIIFSLLISSPGYAQKKIPDNFCITRQEKKLFNAINTLLKDYGRKPLKLSGSLSYVAKLHVEDLLENRPDTGICNLSSWSDKGDWTPCCFNRYVPQQECMWGKPKELTPYPFRGYELAGYFQDDFTADSVIELWAAQKKVLDMLLARKNYSEKEWVCMGIGMNRHYVSVWFGQRPDKVKVPGVCDTATVVPFLDTTAVNKKAETYYLIIASFLNEKDAREAAKRYRKNGFKNAGILKSNNRVRVYLDRFPNLKEAISSKRNLPYSYRDAWIYNE